MSILDSFRLDDKVVIVTGASSGLGVSFAKAFAEAGAHLVIGARRVEQMAGTAALVEEAGRKVYTRKTDVVDPEQCQQLVDSAIREFGRVDVLVNNAGVGTAVPATRETPEQFRKVVDVNLNGSYWMAQACGRVMQAGSSIINISSILGITTGGLPQAAYSASKAGVIGLTRDLAQQWGTAQGNSRQCPRSRLLPERDDRRISARLPRNPATTCHGGPNGRSRRISRYRNLARVSGRRLCDGPDNYRRRRPDHHLVITITRHLGPPS